MSKLEVDKIDPQSGTALEIGSSGDTITIPSGATLDASNATTTLPANVVTTDGTQTLTNKSIATTQLTGTVATSNLGTGTADATTFLRGDQTYASATPAADSITTSQLAYNPNPFRNIIINGDMSIAQRGTSTSGVTNSGYYACDRWRAGVDTAGTWTISQDTDVPTSQGFAKSMKFDCTTANASLSAGSAFFLSQRLEGQNLQYLKKGTSNAESLTASFWVKSNKTGTYILMLDDTDNGRSFSQSYTIDTADTWEKKTLTYAGDTSGTLNNDNARSFDLRFWLVAGTNFTSGTLNTSWNSNTNANLAVGQVNLADSTSNEWYVTGVQLEAGTSASDFEFLPHDVNLRRCQRYYEELVSNNDFDIYWSGYTSSNYDDASPYSFKVEKRAVPSGSFSGSWTYSNINGSTFDLTQITKELITFVWNTSGAGRYYVYNGGSGDKIKFDAEL